MGGPTHAVFKNHLSKTIKLGLTYAFSSQVPDGPLMRLQSVVATEVASEAVIVCLGSTIKHPELF